MALPDSQTLPVAGVAMAFLSVSVVANALRIKSLTKAD
jgi:cation transport ATPase